MTAARKKPPRLERPRKQYTLDQCALYAVTGFGQLLQALKWSGTRDELEQLPSKKGSYSVWQNERGRRIQAAGPQLRAVQARIATLLRRVLPPEYRQSGVRDRSFLTNARQHARSEPSVKLDIKSFYPTTSFRHVRKFFNQRMRCSGDVAFLLAKLCCFEGRHLPTGGVHSEVMAFYCHKDSFDRLLDRARSRGGVMTVYVDDIMITMPDASLTDLEWARRLFAQQDVKLHPGKSKVIPSGVSKTITGVQIKDGKISAPIKQHRMIKERFDQLTNAGDESARAALARSLIGHLDHVAQIEPGFAPRAKGNRARLKALVKNEPNTH